MSKPPVPGDGAEHLEEVGVVLALAHPLELPAIHREDGLAHLEPDHLFHNPQEHGTFSKLRMLATLESRPPSARASKGMQTLSFFGGLENGRGLRHYGGDLTSAGDPDTTAVIMTYLPAVVPNPNPHGSSSEARDTTTSRTLRCGIHVGTAASAGSPRVPV